jgi:Tfp pilus assembly protein PilF
MKYLNSEHEQAVNKLKSGEFDLALEHIQKALQIHKSHPILLAERGTIFMYLKQKDASMEDMDLAIYLDPENPYRFSSRAYIKDYFGDTAGAIEDYERCIELDPEDVIALNNLGLLIEKQGNRKKAERYYKRTDDLLKENPNWQERSFHPESDKNPESSEQVSSYARLEKPESLASKSNEQQSKSHVALQVFTKKSVFREFVQFVFNGFKIKQP